LILPDSQEKQQRISLAKQGIKLSKPRKSLGNEPRISMDSLPRRKATKKQPLTRTTFSMSVSEPIKQNQIDRWMVKIT
jgi:hypothetical protein